MLLTLDTLMAKAFRPCDNTMAFLSLITPYDPLPLFFYHDKMCLEHLQHVPGKLRVGSWGQASLALVCRFISQHFLDISLYI